MQIQLTEESAGTLEEGVVKRRLQKSSKVLVVDVHLRTAYTYSPDVCVSTLQSLVSANVHPRAIKAWTPWWMIFFCLYLVWFFAADYNHTKIWLCFWESGTPPLPLLRPVSLSLSFLSHPRTLPISPVVGPSLSSHTTTHPFCPFCRP
ncbi:hypothetical protein F5Y04DRAFT_18359 [Hypomontagnella monticulosa]|nr:hypothetical protein F5Y04DRAFT_18359 [Hypomontagnella monticulosa]